MKYGGKAILGENLSYVILDKLINFSESQVALLLRVLGRTK